MLLSFFPFIILWVCFDGKLASRHEDICATKIVNMVVQHVSWCPRQNLYSIKTEQAADGADKFTGCMWNNWKWTGDICLQQVLLNAIN